MDEHPSEAPHNKSHYISNISITATASINEQNPTFKAIFLMLPEARQCCG
jgi:hypothetical protein